MERIDLGEYRKSGEGAIGESYDSLTDPTVMVKLNHPGYPIEPIARELDFARKLCKLGIPTPEPGELVTDGERYGIRFRRILGKRSYCRMMADEPERVEEFSRDFARRCRKFHTVHCEKGLFPDAKEQFRMYLDKDRYFSASEKKVIADFIDSVPDGNVCLHGDMHIGNIISTLPKGAPMATEHNVYFIDLGAAACGSPLWDLCMMLQVCVYAEPSYIEESLHIDKPTAIRCWEFFVDEYFDHKYTPAEAEAMLRPYVACKELFIEYIAGFLPEKLQQTVRDVFGFKL